MQCVWRYAATSIVHSKLHYCNSLQRFKSIGSNRFKTPLLVLLLRPPYQLISTPCILRSLHWFKLTKRIRYKLLSHLQSSYFHASYLSSQPDLCSTSSHYLLLICHPFSTTNHLLTENHRLLLLTCITSSLESTSRFISSASTVVSWFTSSHICQVIFHIVAILSILYSHTLSLPGSKPTSPANPSTVIDCRHPWTAFTDNPTGPDLSCSLVYFRFIFP